MPAIGAGLEMKMTTTTTKTILIGSAAALLAVGGAQAADLPLKAKAVEYVKVCSLYGAGFYYIPGTDTCIKLGGYIRADTSFNASGAYDAPRAVGCGAGAPAIPNPGCTICLPDFSFASRTIRRTSASSFFAS